MLIYGEGSFSCCGVLTQEYYEDDQIIQLRDKESMSLETICLA